MVSVWCMSGSWVGVGLSGPRLVRRPSGALPKPVPAGEGIRKAGEGPPTNLDAMTSNQVGASARRTRAVTRRDIELFTAISGDRNPVHYDEDLAARSRFGGIVVQGGVTSGLLNALTNQDDVLVLDGTAVVWRDPAVSAATSPTTHPRAGSPAPTQEKIA